MSNENENNYEIVSNHWIDHSPTLGALGGALAKAQKQIKHAKRESSNPFYKTSYASITEIWDACRSALCDNEISVIQLPCEATGTRVGLITFMLHSSGEYIASKLVLQPRDDSPQAAGSAITYGRRYALAAVAGVAPEDDDGEAATDHGKREFKRESKPAAPSKKQAPQTPTRPPFEPDGFRFAGVVQAVLMHGEEVFVMFDDRVCVAGPASAGAPDLRRNFIDTENKMVRLDILATNKKSKTGLPVYTVQRMEVLRDGEAKPGDGDGNEAA